MNIKKHAKTSHKYYFFAACTCRVIFQYAALKTLIRGSNNIQKKQKKIRVTDFLPAYVYSFPLRAQCGESARRAARRKVGRENIVVATTPAATLQYYPPRIAVAINTDTNSRALLSSAGEIYRRQHAAILPQYRGPRRMRCNGLVIVRARYIY